MTEIDIQILNDHYKDTFSHLKDYLKSRNIRFFNVIILISMMLLMQYSPDLFQKSIIKIFEKHYGITLEIDLKFITSVLWFTLLAVSILYFQITILIERQYKYLHELEEALNKHFGNNLFTREGKSYLSNYPKFSKWTYYLYTIIFPLIFAVVVTFNIILECNLQQTHNFMLYLDLVISIILEITIGLYMFAIHKKK